MVGKIYNGLILLFFVAILVFYGNNLQESIYSEITNEHFNATVYLDTAINQESSIQALKAIADEHELTIAKVIPNDGGGTDVFAYSDNGQYLQALLSSDKCIRILEQEPPGLSGYESTPAATEHIHSFYNREVLIRPLDDLENRGVTGRYALHINEPAQLESVIETINAEYGNALTLYPNPNLPNTYTASIDKLKYYWGLILIAVLFMTMLTSFLYDLKSRRKAIAIKRLLGYDTGAIFYDIFINKAVKPILFSVLIAELLVTVYFALNNNIKDIAILQYFLWGSLKLALLLALAIMAVFALCLAANIARKLQRSNLVAYLKGMETSRNALSFLVKMGSTLLIVVVLGLIFVMWNYVDNKIAAAPHWETTKEYATLNIYIPQYIMQDQKLKAEFEQTHREIWSFLNEKDGILFYKPTTRLNQSPVYIDDREVEVPFAYINENYLQKNPVLDEAGNRVVSLEQEDSNTINILFPEVYKPYEEELRALIHKKHVYDKYIAEDILKEWISGEKNAVDLSQAKIDDPAITERYIYIKGDQTLFTYTEGGDFVTNAVLAVVDSENMGGNVYTPSISAIQAKYDDIDELNRETRAFFNQLGFGAVDSDYNSVYQQNAEDIQYAKSIISFSAAVLVLSLVFMVLSLLFYIEVYYLRNRKRIAIKNFLGFSFGARNKSVFISLFIQDVLILVTGVMAGLLFESSVVGVNIVQPIIAFSLMIMLFDTWCAALALKRRESKYMVMTLKGE